MKVYVRSGSKSGSMIFSFMMMFMGLIIFIMSLTLFSVSPRDEVDNVLGGSIRVDAKLIDSSESGAYDFILEYEVDGETYYYEETNWSGSLPEEGDVMSVMIDPLNPKKVLGVSRSSGIFAGSDGMFDSVSTVFDGVKWGMRIIGALLFIIGLIRLVRAVIRSKRADNNVANEQTVYNQPYNQPYNQSYNKPYNKPYNQPVDMGNNYNSNGYNQNTYKDSFDNTERTYNLNGETYNSHGEKID